MIEIRDGIEHVLNPAEPRDPDKTVRFEEDLAIAPEDNAGNVILFRPRAYAVDGHGLIYISDSADMTLKTFDQEGRLIRSIGRKGEGPGEFESIGRMAAIPGDRLLILDWNLNRFTLLSPAGRFLDMHKFKVPCFDLYLAAESFYVREEAPIEPSDVAGEWKRRLFVKACDYSGEELFSYGEFTASQSKFVDDGNHRFSFSISFDINSVFAGDDQNGWIYHCLNENYMIEVFDRTGRLFRKIERPYSRLPFTEQDKQKYLAGFSQSSDVERALIAQEADFPELRSVTERMLLDDSGRLWVALNETREVSGRQEIAHDIFDRNGIYLYRVWCDPTPGLIKNGLMYRMETEEETGYRILKRYRIVWSD